MTGISQRLFELLLLGGLLIGLVHDFHQKTIARCCAGRIGSPYLSVHRWYVLCSSVSRWAYSPKALVRETSH